MDNLNKYIGRDINPERTYTKGRMKSYGQRIAESKAKRKSAVVREETSTNQESADVIVSK